MRPSTGSVRSAAQGQTVAVAMPTYSGSGRVSNARRHAAIRKLVRRTEPPARLPVLQFCLQSGRSRAARRGRRRAIWAQKRGRGKRQMGAHGDSPLSGAHASVVTRAPGVLLLDASQTIPDALGRPARPGQGEEREALLHKEIGRHVGRDEVHPRHYAVSLARRSNGV